MGQSSLKGHPSERGTRGFNIGGSILKEPKPNPLRFNTLLYFYDLPITCHEF